MLVFLIFAIAFPFAYGNLKIVGGDEITIEQSPYTASLQYIYPESGITHVCGASIISTKYLLTACTNCDPGINIINYYARVGSTYYNKGGQLLKVKSFISHPEYNFATLDNDIGIVTFLLEEQIVLGPNAAIIKLTDYDDHGTNSLVAVTGWGVTEEHGSVSENLKQIFIPIYDFDLCKATYSYLTPRQICIGGVEGNKSACHGDAGGPAVHLGQQIAVVSGGRSCHLSSFPGLYARISSFRSWITCVTGVE